MKTAIFLTALAALLTMIPEQSPGAATNYTSTVETLSGTWKIATDPKNVGRGEKWFDAVTANAQVTPVPGIIQQMFPAYHGVAWYWHDFRIDRRPVGGDRIVIRFGAVDYMANVWVNGVQVGTHEGGETPFECDVTDIIKPGGDNLLAVRVLNPTYEPIDGVILGQTSHRNKDNKLRAGDSFNCWRDHVPGAITFPACGIHLVTFVRPDLKTGRIAVTLTVHNSGSSPIAGNLSAKRRAGRQRIDELNAFSANGPLSTRNIWEHELSIEVAQPRPWNLDDPPSLYQASPAIPIRWRTAAASNLHPLRLPRLSGRRAGGFTLNGKRLFLKSTHTGNVIPIGQQQAAIPDFVRRDFINAKASGFNTVRFVSGVAFPEQLDFADEVGLLVYESCYASWLLDNSPKMAERFEGSTSDMIRRDRNHPSVAIWGLLNETGDGPVFREALNFLPKVRMLDPTRLVLLSSGRWDGQWSIGSVSNPGGTVWEHVWGSESPDAAPVFSHVKGKTWGMLKTRAMPIATRKSGTLQKSRSLSVNSVKPRIASLCFFQEYGVGSMFDVIGEWHHFEQAEVQAGSGG